MKFQLPARLQSASAAPDHPAFARAAGWTPRTTRLPALRMLRLGRPRIARRVLAFLLVIPLLVGVTNPQPASGDDLSQARAQQRDLATKISQQRAEVARLRTLQANLSTKISSTAGALNGINANLASSRTRVRSLSTDVATVKALYTDLVAQVKDLDGQILDLEAEQQAKAQQLDDRKQMLTLRLREAYNTDRTPIFQQLLSAGSIADVFEDVGSYLDFGSQDRDLALQIEHDQQVLDSVHASVVEARAAKAELRTETLAQKKQLDARMRDLVAAQTKLTALQNQTQRQLAIQRAGWAKMQRTTKNLAAVLARDQVAQNQLASRIHNLIVAQQQQPRGGNIPSTFNGALQWPMAGSVTQEFGCTGVGAEPPLGGCSHFHQGIDIAAPMYTPIRAAAAGTVVFAGANPYDPVPKAWIVIIAHSGGLQTWYAHIDNGAHGPAVHAGESVVAGQVIAYEGMTGHTTGPHLHWAVMHNGQFVNPRLFL